jgi:hypothetical protein
LSFQSVEREIKNIKTDHKGSIQFFDEKEGSKRPPNVQFEEGRLKSVEKMIGRDEV